MNSIEIEHIESAFPENSNGKTMEDYFNLMSEFLLMNVEDLKVKFKDTFPEETNWSF